MRTFLLRLSAPLDALAIADQVQRALIARQSGSQIEAIDTSKLSATHLQAYVTIRLPDDAPIDRIQEWVDASLGETPPAPWKGLVLEVESRRLDAEAKAGEGILVAWDQASAALPSQAIVFAEQSARVEKGIDLTCPRCGQAVPIEEKRIDRDGSIGRVDCPWGCGFSARLRLQGRSK